MKKTLYYLSLEEIISLQESSPEVLAEARQASIDFIISELSSLEGQDTDKDHLNTEEQ
ncbi:MAG: hypothetical protein MJY97_01310 [Bacteroidales bacterium]|nr:hypothetical protein [Bacteroidales bacterium]